MNKVTILMTCILFFSLGCDDRKIELGDGVVGETKFEVQVFFPNLTIHLDSTVTIFLYITPGVNGRDYEMNYSNSSMGILQDSTGQLINGITTITGKQTRLHYTPQLLGGQELTFTVSDDETSVIKEIGFTIIP